MANNAVAPRGSVRRKAQVCGLNNKGPFCVQISYNENGKEKRRKKAHREAKVNYGMVLAGGVGR